MTETLAAVWDRSTLARPRRVRLDTSLELLLDRGLKNATPGILATVVATAGSTYRKPGARMLVMADGSYLGLLSGGCLEADLKLHAEQVLSTGEPRAIEYDMRGPDDVLFGVGAGCQGAMRVLLEPVGPGSRATAALLGVETATREGRPASLVVVHQSDDLPLGTYDAAPPLPARLIAAADRALEENRSYEPGFDTEERATRVFVQFLPPVPHLLICGAGPDAQPVAAAATALGWRVTVIDHRPHYTVADRFAGARVILADAQQLPSVVDLRNCHAVVVMSHHLPSDVAYLRELAASTGPDYIGLLGPRARRERVAHEVGAAMGRLDSRLFGPVGVDLGAETPEGIALAVISQIHALLAGRAGNISIAIPGPR